MKISLLLPILQICTLHLTLTSGSQDVCEGAIKVVENLGVGGSTSSATIDAPGDDCGGQATYDSPGIWYSFKPVESAAVEITTCQSTTKYDTQLTVFEGDCSSLTCLVHNDDLSFFTFCSDVTLDVVADKEYHILVHGALEDTGNLGLLIRTLDAPENDFCEKASSIGSLGTAVSGSTTKATLDFPVDDCGGQTTFDAEGVWYKFQPSGSGSVRATTCLPETYFDTQITFFEGSCGSLSCMATNAEVAEGPLCSEVKVSVEQGKTYYIFVNGNDGAKGNFDLLVDGMLSFVAVPSSPVDNVDPPKSTPQQPPVSNEQPSPPKDGNYVPANNPIVDRPPKDPETNEKSGRPGMAVMITLFGIAGLSTLFVWRRRDRGTNRSTPQSYLTHRATAWTHEAASFV